MRRVFVDVSAFMLLWKQARGHLQFFSLALRNRYVSRYGVHARHSRLRPTEFVDDFRNDHEPKARRRLKAILLALQARDEQVHAPVDRLVSILNANRILDLLQLNILNNRHGLLWPFTVERLLKARKWNVLRFNLATTRPRNGNRNVPAHLR